MPETDEERCERVQDRANLAARELAALEGVEGVMICAVVARGSDPADVTMVGAGAHVGPEQIRYIANALLGTDLEAHIRPMGDGPPV